MLRKAINRLVDWALKDNKRIGALEERVKNIELNQSGKYVNRANQNPLQSNFDWISLNQAVNQRSSNRSSGSDPAMLSGR